MFKCSVCSALQQQKHRWNNKTRWISKDSSLRFLSLWNIVTRIYACSKVALTAFVALVWICLLFCITLKNKYSRILLFVTWRLDVLSYFWWKFLFNAHSSKYVLSQILLPNATSYTWNVYWYCSTVVISCCCDEL